ncbi:MAG: hypothetical protein ACRD9R_09570 [Pyrinomonadaceae bacterium]
MTKELLVEIEDRRMNNEAEIALRYRWHGLMKKNSRPCLKSLAVAIHPAARACLSLLAKGANTALGVGLAACPRRHRFTAARHLARLLQPLRRFISLYSCWKGGAHRVGYRNDALECTVDSLCNSDIEFDPTLLVQGAEAIGPGGAIFVSAHFGLSTLFVRWLSDHGYRVSVVTKRKNRKIPGRLDPLEVIRPDAMALVRIRQSVAAGGVVLIYIDSEHPTEGWRQIEVKYGPLYISDTIMRFAERARIPLLYCATRVLDDGRIVTRITRPSSSRAAVALDEFCQFLQEEIDHTDY